MSSMIRPMEQFVKTLLAARRVSTPLVAIRTADPALTVARIEEAVGKDAAIVQWDIVRGLVRVNDAGAKEIGKVLGERDSASVGPVDALVAACQFGEDAVLVFANAQRFWTDPQVAQAIWNLRDVFKANGRTLTLLTTPGAVLPDELTQDVLVLDEPLPAVEDLTRILEETMAAAEVPELETDASGKAVDALLGLAAFPAEQVLAMSLSKKGLDLEQLWERKRQVIEQAPGLSVLRGGESFDDIGGCSNIKRFLTAVIEGEEAPRGIVFLDEIEKAFAGTGTDLSGVKTELTGTVLAWMQDRNADGCILIGPPGAAKSLVAKATGNTARIPTIAFDLGAMQNALVGASGERLRAALKVVDAVTNGRSLWIATCNSIGTLPPELRRRFTLGTFFFDLPSPEERAAIWKIYVAKYGVCGELPDDDGWTGAGIKECCRKAYRLKLTLKESAEYLVPVSRSAADQIKALRQQASGKFISASYPGPLSPSRNRGSNTLNARVPAGVSTLNTAAEPPALTKAGRVSRPRAAKCLRKRAVSASITTALRADMRVSLGATIIAACSYVCCLYRVPQYGFSPLVAVALATTGGNGAVSRRSQHHWRKRSMCRR